MRFFRSFLLMAGSALLLATAPALAAPPTAPTTRIDPTYWFVGMKNPKLQLLVNAPGIAADQVTLATYPGVTLDGFQKLESTNYLIVNLTVSPQAQPGKLKLQFTGAKPFTYSYELRPRNADPARVQGLTQADFIYFLMPDRFSNGNPKNDVIKGTRAPRMT
ncbi:MAG: alpha-amylase, partial [Hymenobacter sp.]